MSKLEYGKMVYVLLTVFPLDGVRDATTFSGAALLVTSKHEAGYS